MANFHGSDVYLLSGQQQIAQVHYRPNFPVNGPFQVNLTSMLKTLFPNYAYFRFRSARISFSLVESGKYNGSLKLIIQDGTVSTVLTKDSAKITPGYIVPAYFNGPFLPLPLAYLDNWYSIDVDPNGQLSQAPNFTFYVSDLTSRETQLNNAATFFLKVSVAATNTRPTINPPSNNNEDGGVSLASVEDTIENVEELEEEPEYVKKSREALKAKFEKAQQMLVEEQSGTVSSAATDISFPSTNFGTISANYIGGTILDNLESTIKIRGRDKYTFDAGYGVVAKDFELDLSQLKFVKYALQYYNALMFKDLVITVTPNSIQRSGSHTSIHPYIYNAPSQSQTLWYRSDPGDYRFVWNRYQPGPFTPFPHLYLDRTFNNHLLNPIPTIILQFSGWADSGMMNIFVDYKIKLSGKRNSSTGLDDIDHGAGISKLSFEDFNNKGDQ